MAIVGEDQASPLNIRIKAKQRDLIEQAARMTDQSLSDFVRNAALGAAQDAVLDRRILHLSEQGWQRFQTALDTPPTANPRLSDLMKRTPVWER